MPIVSDDNSNVWVEYSMPNNIREIISPDFMTKFVEQLDNIFHIYDMNKTNPEWNLFDDIISELEGTGGWYNALKKTTKLTNKTEIINYYETLPWYDSDLFDYELTKLIKSYVERKIIYVT